MKKIKNKNLKSEVYINEENFIFLLTHKPLSPVMILFFFLKKKRETGPVKGRLYLYHDDLTPFREKKNQWTHIYKFDF